MSRENLPPPRLSCPVCGARPPARAALRRRDGSPLKRCRECEALFVDAVHSPHALASMYAEFYFRGGSDFFRGRDYCRERDNAIAEGAVTGFAEILENFDIAGKSILDVGCASGALLQSLKRFDPAMLVGIDLAGYPVEFGRRRYGLDLRCTTLERAGFREGTFDLVTLIDLVEHLPELASFLDNLRACLKPRGALYISTPNADAYRVAGRDWIALSTDYEHLCYLATETLSRVAGRHGLILSKTWTSGWPVAFDSYRRPHAPRLLRVAAQPRTALRNAYLRLKYRRAAATGCGGQLHAILHADPSWAGAGFADRAAHSAQPSS
jgi:2-polyprenyl-6-hydroxyphenyl methylase/3-demethylubiquinone-9 3-methyltransferase